MTVFEALPATRNPPERMSEAVPGLQSLLVNLFFFCRFLHRDFAKKTDVRYRLGENKNYVSAESRGCQGKTMGSGSARSQSKPSSTSIVEFSSCRLGISLQSLQRI